MIHFKSILPFLVWWTIIGLAQEQQEFSFEKVDSACSLSFNLVRLPKLSADSASFDAELEDSISGMDIKRIEQPKELLKACLAKLKKDLKKKHSKREYLYTKYYYPESAALPPFVCSSTKTIELDDGVNLRGKDARYEWGPLHTEGPYPLGVQDSSHFRLYLDSGDYTDDFCHLREGAHGDYCEERVLFPIYRDLVRFYDIEAFSISQGDSGRGVYRIDLYEKKVKPRHPELNFAYASYRMRMYFDIGTLRLTGIRSDVLERHGRIRCYKKDFGEEDDVPVLKKLQSHMISNGRIVQRNVVQLQGNE